MMSFCKKSVHSFLALTNHPMNVVGIDGNVNIDRKPYYKCEGVSSSGGLGLITATTGDHIYKTPNILESTTVKSSSPPSPPPSSTISSMFKKVDPGGIGFIDDIGGAVDGLMSCTESLGFESSDERRVDDESLELCSRERFTPTANKQVKWRKYGEGKQVKKFPPPISSLNHNGQPSFFLKAVRKDGRLELTEIRIDRPEILRASRQDGRLRLDLIRDDEEYDQQEQENEMAEEQEQEELLEEEEEKEEEEEFKEKIDEEKEERLEEWSFTVNGGEGFRRCHELVACHHDYHHHHHHSNVWNQHCVTTR